MNFLHSRQVSVIMQVIDCYVCYRHYKFLFIEFTTFIRTDFEVVVPLFCDSESVHTHQSILYESRIEFWVCCKYAAQWYKGLNERYEICYSQFFSSEGAWEPKTINKTFYWLWASDNPLSQAEKLEIRTEWMQVLT